MFLGSHHDNTVYISKKVCPRLCDPIAPPGCNSWFLALIELWISCEKTQTLYDFGIPTGSDHHGSVRSWASEESVDDKEASHDPRGGEAKLPPLGEGVLPWVSFNLEQKRTSTNLTQLGLFIGSTTHHFYILVEHHAEIREVEHCQEPEGHVRQHDEKFTLLEFIVWIFVNTSSQGLQKPSC